MLKGTDYTFCNMNEFTFDEFNIFTTQKLENLTQAEATCSKNNGEITNLSDFNFKAFAKLINTDQAANLESYFSLRVQPVNSTLNQCYGLLNLFFLNAEGGLSENVNNICRENDEFLNGRFNTMCSTHSNAVSAQRTGGTTVPVVIGASVFVFVALLSGLFIHYVRSRRFTERRRQTSSFEEQQIIKESDNVRFIISC